MFVTHDLQEAIQLGDRMLILGRNGKVLDDFAIALPRPRDFTTDAFVSFYAASTKRFFALQHAVEQDATAAV